jgi:hypothetical protein
MYKVSHISICRQFIRPFPLQNIAQKWTSGQVTLLPLGNIIAGVLRLSLHTPQSTTCWLTQNYRIFTLSNTVSLIHNDFFYRSRQPRAGEIFSNSIHLHCDLRVSLLFWLTIKYAVFWMHSALSSHSPQNIDFTGANRQFSVSSVYTATSIYCSATDKLNVHQT